MEVGGAREKHPASDALADRQGNGSDGEGGRWGEGFKPCLFVLLPVGADQCQDALGVDVTESSAPRVGDVDLEVGSDTGGAPTGARVVGKVGDAVDGEDYLTLPVRGVDGDTRSD